MKPRSWTLSALILGYGCLFAVLAAAGDDGPRNAKFTELMAATARTDPDAPAVLEGLLEHAQNVLQTHQGHCEMGLEDAQAAFDAASNRPAVGILLPLGPARLTDLSYKLHRAKAVCAGDTAVRDAELHLALEAAQQGVERYGDALDYPSMAIMQFNVAATLHLLGDQDAAVSALAAAINIDREYGLREDAHDNEQLMREWRLGAQPDSPPDTELAPARSATLKFAWRESDAQEKIEISVADLSQGAAARAHASKTVKQTLRQVRGFWRLTRDLKSAAPIEGQGFQEHDALFGLVLPMAEALLAQPNIEVDAKGNFEGAAVQSSFSTQLVNSTRGIFSEVSRQRLPFLEDHALNYAFTPDMLWAQSEDDYNLQTGAWIGATLEQGTWYRTTTILRLPGMSDRFLPHDVEFAYTRDVPCTPAEGTPQCVEIVMHATPAPPDLDEWASQVSTLTRRMRYWSSTYIRLVTDPQNLTPYCLDVRRYWHLNGRPFPFRGETDSGMERVVTTYTYGPPARGGPS